jgi:hypothetical protein
MEYDKTTKIQLSKTNVLELLDNFANFQYDECGDGPHEKGYTLEEVLKMKRQISERESAFFEPVTPYEMSKLLHAKGLPQHMTNLNQKIVYWTSQGMARSHPKSRFEGEMILAKLKFVPGVNKVTETQFFGDDYEYAGRRITKIEIMPKVTLDYSTAVVIPELLWKELGAFCTRSTSRDYEEYIQKWEEIGPQIYFPMAGAKDKGLGSVNLVDGFHTHDGTFDTCHAFVCWNKRFTLYDISRNPRSNWGSGYNACWLKRVR